MGSLLVLSLAVVSSLAVLLISTGFVLFRAEIRSLAYWLHAWGALLCAAFVALLLPEYPAIYPVGFLFSSFVPPFMVLGAAAHVGRSEPTWLIPGSLLVAALRVSAYLSGAPDVSMSIAMCTELTLGLTAAWLVVHPEPSHPRSASAIDYVLAAGFVLYAGVEVFDAGARMMETHGWAVWAAWFTVSLPLSTIQIALSLDRAGRATRRFEDDARANAMRLQALTESSYDFLIELDDRGVITFTSPGVAAIVGHRSEELVGRSVYEFENRSVDSVLAGALVERGRIDASDVAAAAGIAHRAVLPNGEERWFDFLGTTYRTLEGELRIVARVRDITTRIQEQDDLSKSEARLRRAERIAKVASWELDPRTDRLIFSDELFRIHGLERGDGSLAVEAARALIHPDDRETAIAKSIETRTSGTPTDHVYRIRRSDDGAIRTLHVFSEADFDARGTITRLVGATIDVTEQQALTDQLRKGEERFQSLVDSNIVGVFFAGRDGSISEANRAFLTMVGHSKSDLPLDWRRLTAAGFRDHCDPIAAESDSPATAQSFEHEFVARDGRHVPMLLSFVRLSQDSVIVIAVDLRERMRAEADRARYQQELEEKVADRTRELLDSRARLIEHERLAVVGTLAAGVAHQINNPIGAILNCCEYALLCGSDEDSRATFERALHDNLAEARRCALIVRSMLQFARDQPTSKWVEDLGRVVRRAQRAINAYAKDRGATISYSTQDENLFARISPIELEQAIVNVLRNAIESRSRDVQVSILLTHRDKNAVLEITDDGCGIEAEHLERLFEPFFSTRTREGGTGLGLSVTHGIIVDHGGQIRVDSVPGTGTCVVITLPLEDSVVPSDLDAIDPD